MPCHGLRFAWAPLLPRNGAEGVRVYLSWYSLRRVILTAGWAPSLVFAVHVVLSQGIGAYEAYPSIDIPMHALGGFVMAYFVARCVALVQAEGMDRAVRRAATAAFVVTATATAAVFWEFAEYTADAMFSMSAQLGLEDTLLDLALGIVGAVAFVSVDGWRGLLGLSENRDPNGRSSL